MPLATMADGVIWPPEGSTIRAQAGGVVARVLPRPGDWLSPGQPVLDMSDPILSSEVRVLEAQQTELLARRTALAQDPFGLRIIEREIAHVEERLGLARARLADLTVVAPGEGVFLSPTLTDLPGRYLGKGELVGFVTRLRRPIVRVAVPASEIDMLRERTRAVEVRLTERPAAVLRAEVRQISPAATRLLPHAALGVRGGGSISEDPAAGDSPQAIEDLFNIELELPLEEGLNRIGGRVHVRFDQGTEPLGWQLYRVVRRLFLTRFDV
jgi:putative peptide zinc metalloprotease protein